MGHCERLMISKANLKKLVAIGIMGFMSVGYVVYQSRLDDVKVEGHDANDDLMENISMFSSAYESNGSNKTTGRGQRKNDKEGENPSDGTSLIGSAGAYEYSRIGKAFKHE